MISSVRDRVWPRPLAPGDVVTVVAPSGPSNAERLAAGSDVLRSWGLEVRYAPHTLELHARLPYLAGEDALRAADLVAAWTDPDTAAVWAARGGYGAQRMVDRVDYDALRLAGPKHLIGFSDITALHARVGRELDQVTIHGPVAAGVGQLGDAASASQVRSLVMAPPSDGMVLCTGTSVVDGSVVGRLIGGNLALVSSDVGVEPAPSVPSVVVLEDVGEDAYRVDRMLTQLLRSGWFASVVGVVIGDFTDTEESDLIADVVADRLDDLGLPTLRGAAVGHGERNLALPLGARVRLDCTGGAAALTLAG